MRWHRYKPTINSFIAPQVLQLPPPLPSYLPYLFDSYSHPITIVIQRIIPVIYKNAYGHWEPSFILRVMSLFLCPMHDVMCNISFYGPLTLYFEKCAFYCCSCISRDYGRLQFNCSLSPTRALYLTKGKSPLPIDECSQLRIYDCVLNVTIFNLKGIYLSSK